MNSKNQHTHQLFTKIVTDQASAQEVQTFIGLLNNNAHQEEWTSEFDHWWDKVNASSSVNDFAKARVRQRLMTAIDSPENQSATTLQPIHPLKTNWLRYVAAAILILTIGWGAYYFSNQASKLNTISGGTGERRTTVRDIAPGTNRAILTINNSQNIDLATNKTGININNTITYNDGERVADAGQLLQLTTPRGGQYQAVLPDGSKVWLNAASSIKFPSKFSTKERRVEVTGEVYFEIAKNINAPFSVTAGNTTIQVLGTSFNISAYPEEETQRTTLVSGSVKVLSNNQEAILKPGEAADVKEIIKIINADIEKDIAWKNGMFNFTNLTIEATMRQIARWYDVEIVYDQGIPKEQLYGKLFRDISLQDLLAGFNGVAAKFTLEGRTLYVRPL